MRATLTASVYIRDVLPTGRIYELNVNEQMSLFDIRATCHHIFKIPPDNFRDTEVEVPCSTCGFKKKMVTWNGLENIIERRGRGYRNKGGLNRALKYR